MSNGREHDPDLTRIADIVARSMELIDQATRDLAALIDAQRALIEASGVVRSLESFDDCRSVAAEATVALDRKALRLAAIAHSAARRSRDRHFARSMFGEPAWDMLLALYIGDWAGARFTLEALSEHVGMTVSSGARWIGCLSREQLVCREDHPGDCRKAFISLSDRGRASLDAFFTELGDFAGALVSPG